MPVTTTGWPRAITRPEVPPVEVTQAPEPEPPPQIAERLDAFAQLVSLLTRVALAGGATRAAAVLPAFLAGQVVELPETSSVIASGHAVASGSGVVISEGALGAARAWRAVLTGESEDLSGCEETLDSWCAGLLAALCGTPSRANELRRELRRFGVAAFGLLAEAA